MASTSLKAQLRAPVGIPCNELALRTAIRAIRCVEGNIRDTKKRDYLFHGIICSLMIFTATELNYVCWRRSGVLVLRQFLWRCSEFFVKSCSRGEETLDVTFEIGYSCAKYPLCRFVQNIGFLQQPIISLILASPQQLGTADWDLHIHMGGPMQSPNGNNRRVLSNDTRPATSSP